MARPAGSDLFHSFRFWVTGAIEGGGDPLAVDGNAAAGFQSCTVPDYTMEAVEYREGHHLFTRKYPGLVTTSDLTLARGVVFKDRGLFDWLLAAFLGGGEYRADIEIKHIHRTAAEAYNPAATTQPILLPHGSGLASGYRVYQVYEAIPGRVKPAGDLESTTADVSVAEADVAYEYFTIADVPPTVSATATT